MNLKTISIFFALFWAGILIFISWAYRDDAFQSIYDPGIPYQTYAPPKALDYTMANSWLTRPDPQDDPIHIKGGDVFVAMPSFYLGRHHWNAPTDNAKYVSKLTRIGVPNYVAPYSLAGRVFAPNYRQAALYSLLNHREDAKRAQMLAYHDIKRAFEIFIQESPPERPIILIGHGQGGLYIQKLLDQYFTDTYDQGRLRTKLAAAYIIDFPVPLDRFEDSSRAETNTNKKSLHACQNKQDTGCINGFGAFQKTEKTRIERFANKTLVWNKSQGLSTISGRDILCTNPLSWQNDSDHIGRQNHLGGVAAEGLGSETIPAPISQQTSAQCMDGYLRIDKPEQKSLRRAKRFGGHFRTAAFNLFYEDIRVDMARRMQIVIDKNILPRRAPLMEFQDIEIKESVITDPLKRYRKGGN